jgi:hypothetical protein
MATYRASRGRARAITAKQYRGEPRVIDLLLVTADHTGVPSGDNITYTLHFAAASASTTVDVDSPSTLSVVSAEGGPTTSDLIEAYDELGC